MIRKRLVFLLPILLVSACASQADRQPEIERRHYGEHEAATGYTQAVRVGDMLYLSGITHPGNSMTEQLAGVYGMIEKVLADYGATTADIVKETVYATNMDALIEAIPLRKDYFPEGIYPAATWVQVERLFLPELLIEVDAVVRIKPGR